MLTERDSWAGIETDNYDFIIYPLTVRARQDPGCLILFCGSQRSQQGGALKYFVKFVYKFWRNCQHTLDQDLITITMPTAHSLGVNIDHLEQHALFEMEWLLFWLRFTDLLTQEFCPKVNRPRRELNYKVGQCWELRCLSPSRIHSAWITILLLPALIFRVNKYEICIQNPGRGESVNTGSLCLSCVGRNEWTQS